jgi:hypothetical protein
MTDMYAAPEFHVSRSFETSTMCVMSVALFTCVQAGDSAPPGWMPAAGSPPTPGIFGAGPNASPSRFTMPSPSQSARSPVSEGLRSAMR